MGGRCYNPHRNNVFQGFIHVHVELDHLIFREHQKKPRSWVRRGWNIDADVLALKMIGYVASRLSGQERDGPGTWVRILDEERLPERHARWR